MNSFIGMKCLEVSKIIRTFQAYEIYLPRVKLFCSSLHAFVLSDGSCKKVEDLISGDLIWVDVVSFQNSGRYQLR